jgi:hypothetical protein
VEGGGVGRVLTRPQETARRRCNDGEASAANGNMNANCSSFHLRVFLGTVAD